MKTVDFFSVYAVWWAPDIAERIGADIYPYGGKKERYSGRDIEKNKNLYLLYPSLKGRQFIYACVN